MFPKPKYNAAGELLGSKGDANPYAWLEFIDFLAGERVKDYDEIYQLNWVYTLQIAEMKTIKNKRQHEQKP